MRRLLQTISNYEIIAMNTLNTEISQQFEMFCAVPQTSYFRNRIHLIGHCEEYARVEHQTRDCKRAGKRIRWIPEFQLDSANVMHRHRVRISRW